MTEISTLQNIVCCKSRKWGTENKIHYVNSCYFILGVPKTQFIIRLISQLLKMLPCCRKIVLRTSIFIVRHDCFSQSRNMSHNI